MSLSEQLENIKMHLISNRNIVKGMQLVLDKSWKRPRSVIEQKMIDDLALVSNNLDTITQSLISVRTELDDIGILRRVDQELDGGFA